MVLYLTAHNSFTVIELGFEKPFKNSSLLTFLKGEVAVRKSLFLICYSYWSFAQEQVRSKELCVLVEMSPPCWRGTASHSPQQRFLHTTCPLVIRQKSLVIQVTWLLPKTWLSLAQRPKSWTATPKNCGLFWLQRITAGPTQERLQSFEQH